ncbi:MAG: hypothetical protein ACR2N2_04200 [Acidimicrobiia bacterium]
MILLQIVAQETNLPTGGTGQIIFWLIGAGTIAGLYFLIARTRKKSYNEYWDRRRTAEQQKRNDPDMAHESADDEPDEDQSTDSSSLDGDIGDPDI